MYSFQVWSGATWRLQSSIVWQVPPWTRALSVCDAIAVRALLPDRRSLCMLASRSTVMIEWGAHGFLFHPDAIIPRRATCEKKRRRTCLRRRSVAVTTTLPDGSRS